MKVFLAQLNPRIGDFTSLKSRMLQFLEEARRHRAQLVVFPELATCGYPPRDWLESRAFIDGNIKLMDWLTNASQDIAIICGGVERNPSPLGKPLWNAAVVLADGKRIATAHKSLLPYYDVFDEPRHFESGDGITVFSLHGHTIAVSICEDVWNLPGFVARPYPTRPLEMLAGRRVDFMVHLSASPFEVAKPQKREALFSEVARTIQAPVLVCGQTGSNEELIFDGGSLVMSAKGEVLLRARSFHEEGILYTPELSPVAGPLSSEESFWLASALECGVNDYVKKSGASKVILGLSGGIDSSVVAAIATRALGPAAVAGVALPTRFTSRQSLEDAASLARNLQISYRIFSIEESFATFSRLLPGLTGGKVAPLTLENLQPRLRMAALMALANEEGRLLLNTSNKSEIATGYATMYGDSAGAIAVLGDLLKHQVYALARYYNQIQPMIPESVLSRPPTAELRENQTDQDTLPPYDVLDKLVEATLVHQLSPSELKLRFPEDAHWVDVFFRLYRVSEYKRRQLPPVLRVSSKAFGMGRRIPVTSEFPKG